jgi:hypothetical protein
MSSGVLVGEAAGQFAMGVGLGEQVAALVLEGRDGVGAANRSGGSSWLASVISASASLAGSPPCKPFMLFQLATVCSVRSA